MLAADNPHIKEKMDLDIQVPVSYTHLLVNGDEMYWVTQEIFTAGDLRKFQQAVQSYDGDIKKFYVCLLYTSLRHIYRPSGIRLGRQGADG